MKQILPICLLFTVFVAPVSAAPVAYDGLNAPAGPLHGTASGWNLNAWDVQNGNLKWQVASPGLTYGSLAVTGNCAVGDGDWVSAGVGISMPATWDPDNEWVPWRKQDGDTRYKAGAEGTTLWASFLARQDLSNNDYTVNFHENHIAWNPGSEGGSVGLSNGVWTLSEIGGGTSASTSIARTVGQTYLMVLQMEFLTEGSDRVTLYVDPTPGLALPSVAGTSITTTKDFCFSGVSFYPGNVTGSGALDELRFGASYADVTPIPEPATIALLALGGLGLLGRKRN
jgi:hypothetical protein